MRRKKCPFRQDIHIKPDDTGYKPSITFSPSNKANNATRQSTVGMGVGQIPIQEWQAAKAQGISFKDFKGKYKGANSPKSNPVIRQVLHEV